MAGDGYTLPPSSPVGPGGVPINMPSTGGTPGSNWAAAIQQQATRGPSMTGSTQMAPDDPLMAPIYLGTGTRGSTDATPHGFGSSTPDVPMDATTTIDDLLAQFEDMDAREQRRLALLLTIAGFGPSVDLADAGAAAREMTLNETLNAYLELLDDAAGRYNRGQKVTPDQLLEQNIAYRLPRGSDWDGSFDGLVDILHENDISTTGIDLPGVEDKPKDLSGTRSTTATSTSVSRDVMDPNDAMALTRAMLQRELGRDPTKAEFEDFVSAVQAAQRSHPSKSTTTTTRTVTTGKKGRVLDQDTSSTRDTQRGITGAGINDILLRKARSQPDWAEWQAVGTYAPALFQALGATVPGV